MIRIVFQNSTKSATRRARCRLSMTTAPFSLNVLIALEPVNETCFNQSYQNLCPKYVSSI